MKQDYLPTICFNCIHYHVDCPLSGMTASISDEVIEGNVTMCIHHQKATYLNPAIHGR